MDATRRYFFSLLVGLSLALISTPTHAQYREETGALEQIYESRARAALNTLLRPEEYSIVVAAEIERDQKRLLALEEDMDKMFLPGVPGLQMSENLPIANRLHELRNRIDVVLVLHSEVSPEQEATAKSLVKMKLQLDESAGDTLTVSRALSLEKTNPPSPDVLPELSWRMWALILLLGLLGTGMVLLLLNRNKKAAPPPQFMTAPPSKESKEETPASETPSKDETRATSEATSAGEEDQAQLVELYERKKSLIALATQYPEAAAAALAEHFAKGHEKDLLLTCEALGWELSKKVFRDLSHRAWARLGMMISSRAQDPTPQEFLEAVKACHQAVVGRYLDLVEGDESNPFAFLSRMNEKDRNRLLRDEDPGSLALLCASAPKEQVTTVLEVLSEDNREAVLLQLTRLQEIPGEALRMAADRLKSKFKAYQSNPSVELNGVQMTLDLLENLDPVAEYQFLKSMREKHHQDFEALRLVHLMYEDILFVPVEIVSDACSSLDLKILALALAQDSSETRTRIFAALPPKRARMLEKDIAYLRNVSAEDALLARRQLLRSIRAHLSAAKLSPSVLIEAALDPAPQSEAA